MLIALEGSSPTIFGENNYKYYVWDAYRFTKQRGRLYVEGPAAISWDYSPINIRKMSDKATAFIHSLPGKVYLIGWSRGAAACIQVAHDLKNRGRRVDAMFLFDAVDQDGSTGSDLNVIPDSVNTVYHAVATKKSWTDQQIFPTCGKRASPGVNLVSKNFNTSHGGIAGAGDGIGDDGSRDWMWTHLRSEGVL